MRDIQNRKLYILKTTDIVGNHYYKIGMTYLTIEKRIKSLRTGCPFKIEIYATLHDRHALDKENSFKAKFKEFNTNGEWFHFKDKDHLFMEFIQDNKITLMPYVKPTIKCLM